MKNLTIKFVADTANAEKSVDRLYSKIRKGPNLPGAGASGGKALNPMQGMIKQTSNLNSVTGGLIPNLGGLAGAVTSLVPAMAVGAAAIGGLALAINKTMHAGMEAEDAITKMTVLFGGNKAKAQETFAKAVDFSNVTPFDPADVVPAAVIAGQYGADAFKKGFAGMNAKKDVMTLIGDMASFSGQTMEEAGTALFRGDLQLLDKYGKAGRDAYENAKTHGAIGSEAFRQAFVKNMSEVKLWDGMAMKRSETISGMWSTIVGNFNTAFLYLSGAGEGDNVLTFWKQLKSIVTDITAGSGSILDELKPLLIELGASAGSMLKGIWDSAKAIGTVLAPVLWVVWESTKKSIHFILVMTTTFWRIISTVANAITWVAKTIFGWISGSKILMDGITKFGVWIDNVTKKVEMVLAILSAWWDAFWNKVSDSFEHLPETIGNAFESLKKNEVVTATVDVGTNAFEQTGRVGSSALSAIGDRLGFNEEQPQAHPGNPRHPQQPQTVIYNNQQTHLQQNNRIDTPVAAQKILQQQKSLSGRP